jgi:folate-binding protein YgfZ
MTDGYRALTEDVALVDLPRDVLRVTGTDAAAFLQGQLSQDLDALPARIGSSADALLLQPAGKVDALLRVTRWTEGAFLLDVDAGWGEAVSTRLRRFLLRMDVAIEPLPWRCLALRGPRAHEVDTGSLPLTADWPGWPGVDVLGDPPPRPEGVPEASPEDYEAARIEAGVPRMGAELDERTIPAEAGVVERAVSFTKGCFVGQELVARIDSRGGNVPRRLRGLVVAGDEVPPAGATVVARDREVGRVTSGARSPARGPVALAYLGRAVEVPAPVVVRWEGAEAAAEARALPLG